MSVNSKLLRSRYPGIYSPEELYQSLCSILGGCSEDVRWGDYTIQDWAGLEYIAKGEQVDQILHWIWRTDCPERVPKDLLRRLSATFVVTDLRQSKMLNELNEKILPALAGIFLQKR